MTLYPLVRLSITSLLLSLTLNSVHAELVDNSASRIMTEDQLKEYYARNNANPNIQWRVKPRFDRDYIHAKPWRPYSFIIELIINEKGEISSSSILESSGNEHLDHEVLQVVKQSKFYPFIINGKAVKGRLILPIRIDTPYRSYPKSND